MRDAGRSGARPEQRQRALDSYIAVGNRKVSGWLEPIALQAICALDGHQSELGVTGSMCEIGVHKARLFILLHLLARGDERCVGFDLFELMSGEVAANYGAYEQDFLHATLRANGCELDRIELVSCNSTTLRPEDVLSRTRAPVRIISVDGGHDAATALSDMLLAAKVLAPGGVVLLDDVFNEQWCGVVEGAARFMLLPDHDLIPYFCAGNKMFFAKGADCAAAYREKMARDLGDVSTKVEQFFGHPVLIAWPPKRSMKSKVAAFVLGDANTKLLRNSAFLAALRGGTPRKPLR